MYSNIRSSVKLLIIGDVMIDHYIHGKCSRISPEAPIPVVEIEHETYTLGGAGNVLKNVKAFGCECDIISVIGSDDNSQRLIAILKENGAATHGITHDNSRCTTIKTRVLAMNHQLVRMDREVTMAINGTVEKDIVFTLKSIIHNYDLVLVSDYNKGLLTPSLLRSVMQICNDAGKRVLVDPKGTDFSKYKGATLIKPNRMEAAQATGIAIKDNDSLRAACERIKVITKCESVIVTLSDDGIALYTDEKFDVIATKALSVVDVTGAGDTVLAALGIMFASGGSYYDACVFANHAAAVVVSKSGSATATLAEIKDHYKV
jgi:rfaE bifunctional protein kinase chain/domain